jgi:hypothetical protein
VKGYRVGAHLASIFLAGLLIGALSTTIVPRTEASNLNLLFISPPVQPAAVVGSTVTYEVMVAQMDPFNAWDILVKTDPAILRPVDFNITPNTLTANYTVPELELAHCVNGTGTGCDPSKGDGPGVVHSAVFPQGSPPPVSSVGGILFTITYVSISNLGSSAVTIISQAIANGGTALVRVTVTDGFYGSSPDFSVTIDPTSLTIPQGSTATGTVTVTSRNGFAGNVTFISDQLVTSLVNPPVVRLTSDGTAISKLLISITRCITPGGYITSILATSGSHAHQSNLVVSVTQSTKADFCIDVGSRNGLKIAQGSSNSSSIIVASPNGFTGSVSLSAYVLPSLVNGPAVSLMPSIVTLSSSNPAPASSLTVTVPLDAQIGIYTVVVNGTSGSVTHFTVDLVTVLLGPPPTFVQFKLLWTHYLSLARSVDVQSWTADVFNKAVSPMFVQVVIRGAAEGFVPFSATSQVTMMMPGDVRSISFSTPIPSSFVGTEVCFTARLVFGVSQTSLSQTSPSSKSGCFMVAP